jgi:hypothetical protein
MCIVVNVNIFSYRGKYYFCSESTIQELTDFALYELIPRKYGKA